MIRKLDRKGFTLIEVLSVLVILVAIMGIAIPTISSSLERTKEKQNESRKRVLESAAELYVTDHKNAVYTDLNNNGINVCAIGLDYLNEYLSEDEMVDADGNPFNGCIIFKRSTVTYKYESSCSGYNNCA